MLILSPATVLSLEKPHLTRLSDLGFALSLRYEADNEVRELNESCWDNKYYYKASSLPNPDHASSTIIAITK